MNISDNKFNNINFYGLNRTLAKNIYKKENIKQINKIFPKSNGIVGNLPPQWLNNIPKLEREKNIKSLYSELGSYLLKNRRYLGRYWDDKYISTFENILKKNKAIKSDEKIHIEYVDHGAYSYGYKIKHEKSKFDLFMKFFYEESSYDMTSHGQHSECNTKTFLKKNLKTKADNSHFTKFYYGDINNGYYIEEFLPTKNSVPQFPKSKKNDKILEFQNILGKFNLYHHDCHDQNYKVYYYPENQYKMVLFDCGGIRKIKQK